MMPRFLTSEKGAVAVYFALIAPVLVGFAALGSEAGLWLVTERKLQQVSDITAYSAATRAISTNDAAAIRASAEARALSSGLRETDTMVIDIPPVTGPNAGRAGFVEVTVERALDRYLTAIFPGLDETVTIRTRTVAGTIPGSGQPVCLLALSPTSSPGAALSGNAEINLPGCALAVNSGSTNAVSLSGNAEVNAACLYSVGDVTISGNARTNLSDCNEPQTLQRPAPDPYAALPMLSSVDVAGLTGLGKKAIKDGVAFTPSEYLIAYPGMPVARFTNGLSFSGNGDFTLSAGLYIIDGNALSVSGNANIYGTGVTFYLMNGATLSFSGNGEVDLKAFDPMTPGLRTDPFAGFLIFGDRTGALVSHSLSGNADSDLDGIIYFPNDEIKMSGNSGSTYPCIRVVASELQFTGNSTINVGCTPAAPAGTSPLESAARVGLLE